VAEAGADGGDGCAGVAEGAGNEVADVVQAHVVKAELGPEAPDQLVQTSGRHGAVASGSSENRNASAPSDTPTARARSRARRWNSRSSSRVASSTATRRAWWVLVSFSIRWRSTWAIERRMAISPSFPVDVAPPEGAALAPPAAGDGEQPQVDAEVGIEVESGGEQLADLVGGGRRDLSALRRRRRSVHG
jgi:hypothetical protein